MNTKINLTYEGQDYTLEFDRMTIKLLENAGFVYDEFMTKPMTNIDLAFTAAFIKNHPKTPTNVINDIYDKCGDKNSLIATLGAMITECYDSLVNEPEDDSGKVKWETVDSTPKKKEEKNQG